MSNLCTLCTLPCENSLLIEGEHLFCCHGCLTVFRILSSQKFEGDYLTHPLFEQAKACGILSNPHLYEERQEEGESLTLHLEIQEMWCPSCAEAISLIIRRKKGIKRCLVDYATDLAVIEYIPRSLSKEAIFALIAKIGYHPQTLLSEERKPSRSLLIRFAISAFCALNLMMLSLPLYTTYFGLKTEGYGRVAGLLSLVLSLPLVTYCAWPIWRKGFLSLRTNQWGMESLVLIGIATAFGYSIAHLHHPGHLYFDSMSMLLTFVLLGKLLERQAKFSAKESLFRITKSLPKKGVKRQPSGEYASVPIKEIQKGDWILVRTGEKVVLDGSVVEGEGIVDASVMTGESMPLRVKSGSRLLGGSVVKQGVLHIEVEASVEEAVLSKIACLIEHDLGQKKEVRSLVDRLIPYFVPSIVLLAALSYPFGGLFRALSILLISCPCAIGIAAPFAESRLLFRFAEKGALVRNRKALTLLAQDPFFAFDKTGTLTEGKFTVLNSFYLSALHQSILKGLTEQTTHPIASAICSSLPASLPLQEVQEVVGRGMRGTYNGKLYRLGSTTFMQESGIPVSSGRETTVHFSEDERLLATIELGDQLRSGIPKVNGVILSGDTPELVSALAKQCGFLWGKGGLDPLQKRAEIEKLPKPVVMVGDGVNDAPAMSAAAVGISVVSATDLCIEISDILLTKASLSELPNLILLAKRGERIIRQNLFWAFIYNIVGIGLALAGFLTPLFAVSAMVLSSLCVILNSRRA